MKLEPSARAEITLPRAESDLLMFLASSNTAPSAPVLLTFSLPGRQDNEFVTDLVALRPRIFITNGLPSSQELCVHHTSEIDEVELSVKFFLRFHVFLLDVNEENAVRSRTVLVHVGHLRDNSGGQFIIATNAPPRTFSF